MKQYIKSYHMFIPTLVKCCIYLYPFVLIGKTWIWNWFEVGVVEVMLNCAYAALIEIAMDTYGFFGIAAKNAAYVECLKTSVKGNCLLKNALCIDTIRRFFSVTVTLLGTYLVLTPGQGAQRFTLLQCLICMFAVSLLVEAAFWITRCCTSAAVNLIACYASGLIAGMIGNLVPENVHESAMSVLVLLILIVFYVGAVIMGRKRIINGVEGSYYDK